MSKTNTIIDIPSDSTLALNIESALTKLPTDAVYNYLHQLAETSRSNREKLESIELTSLILCALELEHQKKVARVQPWKEWVKSNCDFSYASSTRYAKILKCAREDLIPGFYPELIPETAPSLMSSEDLQDSCTVIARALQGLGGIRQLYLQLDIIKTPSRSTILGNRTADNTSKPNSDELHKSDAEAQFRDIIGEIDRWFDRGDHQHISRSAILEFDSMLQGCRDLLKPLTN